MLRRAVSASASLLAMLFLCSCASYAGWHVDEPDLEPEQAALFERWELVGGEVEALLGVVAQDGDPALPGAWELGLVLHGSRRLESAQEVEVRFARQHLYMEWNPWLDGAMMKLWLVGPASALYGVVLGVFGVLPVSALSAVGLVDPGAAGLKDMATASGVAIFLANPVGDLPARLTGLWPAYPDHQPPYGKRLLHWLNWFNPFQSYVNEMTERPEHRVESVWTIELPGAPECQGAVARFETLEGAPGECQAVHGEFLGGLGELRPQGLWRAGGYADLDPSKPVQVEFALLDNLGRPRTFRATLDFAAEGFSELPDGRRSSSLIAPLVPAGQEAAP